MTTRAQSARAPGRGEITRLLEAMREGDPEAGEELSSRVYHELRALAASMLSHEAPGQTLQPTALVHEAWLRLAGGESARFPDRAYFVGLTQEQVAKELGVSISTVERLWAFARAWLFRELERSRNPST